MSEATNALRMDHSTISRRIARLERETGVPLFDRAGKRLAITEAGASLAATAEKLESIVLREIGSISENRELIAGRVRIGATEEFGVHYLAPRLADLFRDHRDLEIELVALPRAFSLATREVDIVVTMDRPTSGGIRFRKLTSFSYGAYGIASYFEARPRPAEPAELAEETWCGFIKDLLHSAQLDIDICQRETAGARYRTTSVSAQLAAALSGYALALLPCFIASEHPRLERIMPEEIAPMRTYWLAVHEDLAGSARVRAVMDAICGRVSRDRGLFQGAKPQVAEWRVEGSKPSGMGVGPRTALTRHEVPEPRRALLAEASWSPTLMRLPPDGCNAIHPQAGMPDPP